MGSKAAVEKAPASAARRKKAVQGATRKSKVKEVPVRDFAWVNRLIILVGVGVVSAAMIKAVIALDGIAVERIVVKGKLERTRTVALQDMVQPALVGGFLSADLQRIRDQLESLPWVYEASVKRQWPNALEIRVVEQLPIARWGSDGFLNHEGEVFQTERDGDWESLPLLRGPAGTAQALIGKYQLINEALLPVELAIGELTLDERGQIEARLKGGFTVVYGDGHLRERLDRFVALYKAELIGRRGELRRVDTRYESGIAVTFDETDHVAKL